MTEKVKENATYDDLVAAPPDRVAELVEGSLYLSPQPAIRHVHATSSLGADLNTAFQKGRRGPGGWWILDEPELHLEGNVLVPDLAGWRRERLPELPDGVGITIAPDWLCEALSSSTARFDRHVKLPRYAAAGVNHGWIVDPSARELEVLARSGSDWTLVERYSGDTRVSAPPFEAIAIDLSTIWA